MNHEYDAPGRGSKWAKELIALQEDGLWGYFHTLSEPHKGVPVTTEQALRRLRILGYTAEDEAVALALDVLRACLRGERQMPDRREKVHDWDLFSELMFAAWLRLFVPDDPLGCEVADRWADVLRAAFADGSYDHAAYTRAYADVFHKPPKGARFIDFHNFYVVALVANRLDAQTERRAFGDILRYPQGIYYVYGRALDRPPEVFAGKEASRYVGALELLAEYQSGFCRESLRFAVAWLLQNKADGGWDFGRVSRDGVYLPLADDWRDAENRRRDCTYRVQKLLDRLGE